MTKQEQTRIAQELKNLRQAWQEEAESSGQPLTQTYASVGLLLSDIVEIVMQFPPELVKDILGDQLISEIYPGGYQSLGGYRLQPPRDQLISEIYPGGYPPPPPMIDNPAQVLQAA